MQPIIWTGHTVQLRSAQKCWHNRTMGLFALIDGSHQSEGRGKERLFHFGFHDSRFGGPARCGSGPTLHDSLPLMALQCVCRLFEGKSILVHSLACPLPSWRTETQDTLTGSIYTAPAIGTCSTFQCRKARPLHSSSLFEDRYKKWEVYLETERWRAFYCQISHEGKKKSHPGSTASTFQCWTVLLS